MRSAGFEPATPSLGSSYPNQAELTSRNILIIFVWQYIFYIKVKEMALVI